jgi:flagellar protein FlaG
VLVEGTQLINRPTGDLAVPARATSLSSSSTNQPKGAPKAPNPEEESLRLGIPAQDSITLSELATSETSGTNTPQKPPASALLAPDKNQEASEEGTGVNTKIKKSIELSQEQEKDKLSQIANDVNERLNDSLSLRFRRDEETGEDIFQLVEQDTGDVVRQIPAEEVLEFMKKFEESLSGLIFSQQA